MTVGTLARVAALVVLVSCVAPVIAAAEPAAGAGAETVTGAKIKSLRRLDETIKRFGGSGDNWHMSWAADDQMYASLCDGRGFPDMPQANYNSRLYRLVGTPPVFRFEFLPNYPDLINSGPKESSRYYNFGTLALGGGLYQFLSTPNHTFAEPAPRFVGAKLIYSPDMGKTWNNQDGSSPVRWEKWDERSKQNMAFFEEDGDAFSLITVLQMGKDYEYNKDGFVYLFAPNGNVEGTMNQVVLCRVPKDKITDRGAYQFYTGNDNGGAGDEAKWSAKISDRKPVLTCPAGWVNKHVHPYAWHPSVVYYAPTGQYLMANWGMGTDGEGNWFGKPSYLGFWTAPHPWGPWTQVHEDTAWTPGGDKGARCYQPQIAPKWIAADGKSFWLVWTDFQVINGQRPYYAFNTQKVEVQLDR